MKIGFIGLGKLGLPCALSIALKGHEVIGHDINKEVSNYIKNMEVPYKEGGPNGEPSMNPFFKNANLKFGTFSDVVLESEIIFVAVQTPHDSKFEGITRLVGDRCDFNYSYLVESMKNINEEVEKIGKNKIVVIVSTVLPGTLRKYIFPVIGNKIKLCYNPFFIAMGTTMKDFLHPEFTLFGVVDDEASIKVEEFYKTIHNAPFYKTTLENAELIKVSYNSFIGLKIIFANTIMEICHKTQGTDCDSVVEALFLAKDRLISNKYLYGGMGDSGGCHPRDNIALSWLAKELNLSHNVFEDMMKCREDQTEWLVNIIKEYKNKNEYLDVVILGLAYKPETNLTVGSCSVLLSNLLKEYNIKHDVYEPYHNAEENRIQKNCKKAIYFIGTKHNFFKDWTFENGSIVIDPFRYIKEQDGIEVVRIGS